MNPAPRSECQQHGTSAACGPRPGEPHGQHAAARARRCGGLALAVALAVATIGCTDRRISVQELMDREQEIASVEPVAVAPQQLALTELRPYTVNAGDVLSVALTGLPSLQPQANTGGGQAPLHARVRDDGTIALPMVGDVHVGGLTLAGVEKAITDAYVPSFVKTLSVYVELFGTDEPTTVVVRGAAGTPGLVTLKNNQRNIMYALTQSGGFGPLASGRVRLHPIRSDEPETIYDLSDVNDLRRALQHPPLESGDMLIVEPQALSEVYVIGLVNVQGPIVIPPGSQLSVVRAIAHAGGLRDFLEPKEATLMRRLPDGEEVRVKLHIADMIAGKEPDIALLPGDVLDVPHTADTRVREWAMANVKLGPFGVGAFYDPITVSTFKTQSNKVSVGELLRDSIISNAVGGILNPGVVRVQP